VNKRRRRRRQRVVLREGRMRGGRLAWKKEGRKASERN